jgi:hypothetical protein
LAWIGHQRSLLTREQSIIANLTIFVNSCGIYFATLAEIPETQHEFNKKMPVWHLTKALTFPRF